VPDQLSIVGFDDSPISRKIWPALTTIRQPIVDMTAIAVESLIAMLGDPQARLSPAISTIYAEHSLVIRGSSGAPECPG